MNRLLIKVCGLTTEDDLKVCQVMGVDLTGFIFHSPSPRNVDPGLVGSWKKKKELRVGVFVNQKPEEILEIFDAARLDLAQLHGGQSPDVCLAVGALRVIRTFWPERFDDPEDFQLEIDRFKDVCRYFLFDAGKSTGGHGRSILSPWLGRIKNPEPFFLAGGLGPENIGNLPVTGMAGLDLNSGVELSPGRKDAQKIRKVLDIVRR
jgi:phosphoribosylanthranilate isomerase